MTCARRLDGLPLTALHAGVMAACALGSMFDLLEIALGNALAAVFSQAPHALGRAELSWLLSAVFVGAIIGAPSLGWLADRRGRRGILVAMLLWLGAMSLACAGATSVPALTLFRLLAGLSLGAFPPTMVAYLTDLLPPARRGMLILAVVAVSTLGPACAIFLIRALTPIQPLGIEAWRWGFIIGGAGSLVACLMLAFAPESPRWLEKSGRTAEAEAQCARFERSRVLARLPPDQRRKSALAGAGAAAEPAAGGAGPWRLVAGVFFLSPWATVAFPLMAGAILAQKGVKLTDALLYIGISMFGPLLGGLVAATMLDRFERRSVLFVTAAVMLASGLVFVTLSDAVGLCAASLTFWMVSSVYIAALNIYGAELFPTHTRATRVAGAWALNRVGAALGPLLLLPLLLARGPLTMFAIVAASLILSMVLLARAPAGRARGAVT